MGLGPRARTSFLIAQQMIGKATNLDESKQLEIKSTLEKLMKECENVQQPIDNEKSRLL
jgi:hypothetical protein